MENKFHRFDLEEYKDKLPPTLDYLREKTGMTGQELWDEYSRFDRTDYDVFDTEVNQDAFSADQVKEVTSLGEGINGKVCEIKLQVGKHRKAFALKDYTRSDRSDDETRRACSEAYANYLRAKEAGLKVFPTVRISNSKNKLLLSFIDSEKYFVLDKQDSIPEESKLETINNITSLVEDAEKEIWKAAISRISIADCLFFLVDKNRENAVNFVIGGYDYISPSGDSNGRVLRSGIWNVRSAFNEKISKLVKGDTEAARLMHYVRERLEEFQKNYAYRPPSYWENLLRLKKEGMKIDGLVKQEFDK